MNDALSDEFDHEAVRDGWIRIASHGIAWGHWRISRARSLDEKIYTLWYVTNADPGMARRKIHSTSRDLAALKQAARTIEAARCTTTTKP